ncbi:ABC transporter permease [Rathayibacter sp. VKM Ac-2754]|uniref:ABC transporter permease n=1 Tax=Rathayibacter sp. VKM Ac-2754 TaxID=2609251 RepID=UPI0013590DCE|nr:ABC transporter permease [Rathayibacter sp. VKM Ac-2754]MWV60778.1 ABC transporter permease [Rathayibacter sp. VKM Ac-2754]
MTTTTTATGRRPTQANRLLAVIRLHFANPATLLYSPLLILAAIVAGSLVIWLLVLRLIGVETAGGDSGVRITGGTFFIFVYMLIVAIQATNVTFALALGYGSTRRDYFLGSALTFVLLSAGWTVLYSLLAALEAATGGWGLGGSMFRSDDFAGTSWAEQAFATFVLFLFFFFVGSATASVYVRWQSRGMTVFFTALGALLLALFALVTLTDGWGAISDIATGIGPTGAFALLLIPTALAAVAGYLLLRRATPRG